MWAVLGPWQLSAQDFPEELVVNADYERFRRRFSVAAADDA
jgi:hypothetical protein